MPMKAIGFFRLLAAIKKAGSADGAGLGIGGAAPYACERVGSRSGT